MSEDENENKQKGGKITAQSIQGKIEAEIKKSKVKGLEAKVKKLVEEINSAEGIVSMKKQELEHLFEDNADLLD